LKGVILAAGQGNRIKDVTYGAIPKELLPIGNVPTIRFPLESLKLSGITSIYIIISPSGKHTIIEGLKSGKDFGVNICYLIQEKDKISGIGKAILTLKNWVKNEDFLVACGDTILSNFHEKNPFSCIYSLIKIHKSERPFSTIMLYPIEQHAERFGVVRVEEIINRNDILYGKIVDLIEKPKKRYLKELKLNGNYLVIAGYYILNDGIFKYIEKTNVGKNNELQITDSLKIALDEGENLYAVIHGKMNDGKIVPFDYWDVGIPESYKEANRKLIDVNIDRYFNEAVNGLGKNYNNNKCN